MINLSDQNQREQALKIQQSYIVQAPAGSGKTELLMQRYLALLAHARAPEEIIAITFTRKAATEMRHRILSALEYAAQNEQPPSPTHQAKTWQLARQVINHAELNKWAILDNPNYLRIQTIDSFCASLTRQMPILSRFGTQPLITEDANILYQTAAKIMLGSLEEDNHWTPCLIKLLLHLDNDFSKVENLLSTMLEKRDQWLTYLAHRHDPIYLRTLLEQGLKNVIDENLFQLERCISQHLRQELLELFAFSQQQLGLIKETINVDENNSIKHWQAFAKLLLTDNNTWRKTVNKINGFPAAKDARDTAEKLRFTEMKKRMEGVLAECTEHHAFLQLLIDLKNLPPEKYNEKQWEIILALLELLPLAVAQLQLLFKEKGEVDYIEIAQSALQALGDAQTPTDLALALDYRIQHLLIDEFQDTSIAQFRLIEQLTAGWQPGDGRTLFLVGDPMQSIYRFRKAEVGLFIKAREQGIGSVKLHSLVLTVNFRSAPIIINWINNVFKNVMPANDDVASGAISFTPSDAGKTAFDTDNTHNEICYYWLNETENEALIVTLLVKEILEKNSQQKIAILVRARNHIIPILNQLKKHNIHYRAVEIETLQQKIIIQDLLALTRALLHPADRIAWLAILRAPWCGLTLTELHQLTLNKEKNLWECLQEYQTLDFSIESQQRIQRFIDAVSPSLKHRERQTLASWIKGTWIRLGGPACVSSIDELEDINTFFKLLTKLQKTHDFIDVNYLEENLAKFYATAKEQKNSQIDVMTIHKAKGLEFDNIILPGLNRVNSNEDNKLLLFMERPSLNGLTDLLIAPIKASDEEYDAIYNHVRYEEKKKADYETARLFYVAATRAKEKLFLIGTLKSNKKDESAKPQANSLLAKIWNHLPTVANSPLQLTTQNSESVKFDTNQNTPSHHWVKRLTSTWQLPTIPKLSTKKNDKLHLENSYAIEKADVPLTSHTDIHHLTARHIGTVVHRLLYKISLDGIEQWSEDKIFQQQHYFCYLLQQQGINSAELENSLHIVNQALSNMLKDENAHWLLSKDHQKTQSEYALTAILDGKITHIIIDRMFIDSHHTRWIIDYKTTPSHIKQATHSIEEEIVLYQPQLEKYAKIMQMLDDKPIKLGLYFPLLAKLHTWDFTDAN